MITDNVTETPEYDNNTGMEPIEKLILRSMNEGVITLECNGDIFTANPAALRILDFTEEELRGRHFQEAFSGDPGNDDFYQVLVNLFQSGHHTLQQEISFKRRDGQAVDLSVATAFLEVDECSPAMQSVVIVFRDITAFKSLERARRRAVNHLSHEIATPLAIISASVENLSKRGVDTNQWEKNIERIQRNLRRLTDIHAVVEQVFSPPAPKPEPFDMASMIQENLRRFRKAASHRSVSLVSDFPSVTTDVVDPRTLVIALETLVKNAVENTPDEGTITVSVEEVLSGVRLLVKDEGVGIPLADQRFIFEGFHHTQATDEYSSKDPFDFNAGGKGLELLRLKILSEAGLFEISFESRRCRYIPTSRDHCHGKIMICPHVSDVQGCRESGGTVFTVLFNRASG
ncbi:MAG: sensor histidine kinase [Desulfomonilaceae bacterium]